MHPENEVHTPRLSPEWLHPLKVPCQKMHLQWTHGQSPAYFKSLSYLHLIQCEHYGNNYHVQGIMTKKSECMIGTDGILENILKPQLVESVHAWIHEPMNMEAWLYYLWIGRVYILRYQFSQI